MSQPVRPILDYMGRGQVNRDPVNVPALVSVVCGICGILFIVGLCAGLWRHWLPLAGAHPGWIEVVLGVTAAVSGAMGALQAPRDSWSYNVSLMGYALGVFIWTLCPVFLLL